MPDTKINFSRNHCEQVIPQNHATAMLSRPTFLLKWIYQSFHRLNPNNWFNDFRNIEVTVEEAFIKKA